MPLLPGRFGIDLAARRRRSRAHRRRPRRTMRRRPGLRCLDVERQQHLPRPQATAGSSAPRRRRRDRRGRSAGRRCAAMICSRNFTFLDLQRLRTPAMSVRGEGDVVEAAGVLELLLGAAHDDALARLARAQQMHGGDAARNRASSREAERRTVAVLRGPAPRNRTSWSRSGSTVRWCSAAARQAAWCVSGDVRRR